MQSTQAGTGPIQVQPSPEVKVTNTNEKTFVMEPDHGK